MSHRPFRQRVCFVPTWCVPTIAATLAVAGMLSWSAASSRAAEMTIGSTAPPLAIEHWLQDGNGRYEEVTDFKDGKVYVVEFWATWCPPCVQSMPHLAMLQEKHRNDDVQIISISTEDLQTVEKFMDNVHPSAPEDRTVAEVTSAYCLTVDPDESVYTDYMIAAEQNGIPCSFIVGKSGLIEWIGHPMLMDQPLEEVVSGQWDREAFKLRLETEKRLMALQDTIQRLLNEEKFDEALQALDDELQQTQIPEFRSMIQTVMLDIQFEANRMTDEVIAYMNEKLQQAKGNPQALASMGQSMIRAFRRDAELGSLEDDFLKEFTDMVQNLEPELKVDAYQMLSIMHTAREANDEAIAALQQAIDNASGRQKDRLQKQLDQMKEQ